SQRSFAWEGRSSGLFPGVKSRRSPCRYDGRCPAALGLSTAGSGAKLPRRFLVPVVSCLLFHVDQPCTVLQETAAILYVLTQKVNDFLCQLWKYRVGRSACSNKEPSNRPPI